MTDSNPWRPISTREAKLIIEVWNISLSAGSGSISTMSTPG